MRPSRCSSSSSRWRTLGGSRCASPHATCRSRSTAPTERSLRAWSARARWRSRPAPGTESRSRYTYGRSPSDRPQIVSGSLGTSPCGRPRARGRRHLRRLELGCAASPCCSKRRDRSRGSGPHDHLVRPRRAVEHLAVPYRSDCATHAGLARGARRGSRAPAGTGPPSAHGPVLRGLWETQR
jgi:hypothetical protein